MLYLFIIYHILFVTENNFYFTFRLAGGLFLGWLCLGWLVQLRSAGGLTGLGSQEALPPSLTQLDQCWMVVGPSLLVVFQSRCIVDVLSRQQR